MTLLDVDVFLYAYDADAPDQARIAEWLEAALMGDDLIGLPWQTIWGFVRISTNSRIWLHPLPVHEVFEIVRGWLAHPGFRLVTPGPRHAELVERLVRQGQAHGPMVTDAVLAALAIEHGASVVSTDRDFARFHDLRWINPLLPD